MLEVRGGVGQIGVEPRGGPEEVGGGARLAQLGEEHAEVVQEHRLAWLALERVEQVGGAGEERAHPRVDVVGPVGQNQLGEPAAGLVGALLVLPRGDVREDRGEAVEVGGGEPCGGHADREVDPAAPVCGGCRRRLGGGDGGRAKGHSRQSSAGPAPAFRLASMRDGASRLGARLVPPLGGRAWRLLAGVVAFEIGTGMTLPLVIVYLHESRGLSLAAAGLALAAVGAGGLAGTVAAGPVVDRFGAGWTAISAMLLAGAGTLAYLAVHGLPIAVLASLAQGAGFGATWVAVIPLLVNSVTPNLRGDVLATNYGLTNLGLGVGSTIAGIVLAVSPNAFRPLFVV